MVSVDWPDDDDSNADHERLELAFPSLTAGETTHYVVESAKVVLRILLAEGAKRAVTLALPGTDAVLSASSAIMSSELFDSAVLHMLDTVSDVELEAARKALRSATEEPSIQGRRDLRNRAATHLESAYEACFTAAVTADKQKIKKLFGGGATVARCYGKAAEVALVIALINRALHLRAAVAPWTARTLSAHDHYFQILFDEQQRIFGGDVTQAAVLADQPRRTFDYGARTAKDWAVESVKLALVTSALFTNKGKPNTITPSVMGIKSPRQEALDAHNSYLAKRNAAEKMVRLASERATLLELLGLLEE